MNTVSVVDRTGRREAYEAPPGRPLLLAGLAAGIGLPHECASGTCGSCRATLVSGDVIPLWPEAPGHRVCRAATDILMCQCVAASPVELSLRVALADTPAHPCCSIDGRLHSWTLMTPDIARFSVELDRPVSHAAGQFALLAFPGLAGARAYSMTRHAPTDRNWTFLVRRLPGGGASARLFEQHPDGLKVQVFGPLGRATFHPDEGRAFVAVAGGSGIAGLLAILDQAQRSKHFETLPSRLFFGLRDPNSAYVLDTLDDVAAQNPGFQAHVAFSDADPDQAIRQRFPHLTFHRGLVHEVAFAAQENDAPPTGSVHYVAGPPAMVDVVVRELVTRRKVPPTEIRYDRFG